MKLKQYLEARGESQGAFARRAGVEAATISAIVRDETRKGPTVSSAMLIVGASREDPAPDGGTVTYEDLLPVEQAG